MRRPHLAVLIIAAAAACSSDTTAPSRFDINPGIPTGWRAVGNATLTYIVGLDNATAHGGRASLSIFGSDTSRLRFTGVGQSINAADYLGKRVRLSGWVRSLNVVGSDIGLWMRVDGVAVTHGLDNMGTRPVIGTSDWHQVEVILDVPSDAVGIAFGALMSGAGQFFVDDLKLEVIPATGQTTNLFAEPQPAPDQTAFYATAPRTPTNLDFEQ